MNGIKQNDLFLFTAIFTWHRFDRWANDKMFTRYTVSLILFMFDTGGGVGVIFALNDFKPRSLVVCVCVGSSLLYNMNGNNRVQTIWTGFTALQRARHFKCTVLSVSCWRFKWIPFLIKGEIIFPVPSFSPLTFKPITVIPSGRAPLLYRNNNKITNPPADLERYVSANTIRRKCSQRIELLCSYGWECNGNDNFRTYFRLWIYHETGRDTVLNVAS